MPTLEAMNARLDLALLDAGDVTWTSDEKDDLLQIAVRRLARRAPKPINQDDAAATITLVADTYYYAIDASFSQIDAVLYENSNGDMIGPMKAGWEISGDLLAGTADLHVSPTTVKNLGTLYLRGFQRYDLVLAASPQVNTILEDHVPFVLAYSRAEAWRRLIGDRARFRQWQNENQTQNVSVNELMQMLSVAEREANDEWAAFKVWQRPTIGRVG